MFLRFFSAVSTLTFLLVCFLINQVESKNFLNYKCEIYPEYILIGSVFDSKEGTIHCQYSLKKSWIDKKSERG